LIGYLLCIVSKTLQPYRWWCGSISSGVFIWYNI